MANNLQLYHKTVNQLCQWLPDERITRLRNMALLLVGLQRGRGIHMSQLVNQWPGVVGKLPSLAGAVGERLGRFLCNPRVEVRSWYEPLVKHLLNQCKRRSLRLMPQAAATPSWTARKSGSTFGCSASALPTRNAPCRWSGVSTVAAKAMLDTKPNSNCLSISQNSSATKRKCGYSAMPALNRSTCSTGYPSTTGTLFSAIRAKTKSAGQGNLRLSWARLPFNREKRSASAGSNSPSSMSLVPTG